MKEEKTRLTVFSKEQYRPQLEYWQGIISHEMKPINLPPDLNRHDQQERAINSIKIKLPNELAGKLPTQDQQTDINLYVVLLAAFKVFLCRYAGNDEILIASPLLKMDNQPLKNYQFNKRILLRDMIDTGLTFKKLLLDTKNKTLSAYENQNYPLHLAFENSGLHIENYFFLDRIIFSLKNIHEENEVIDLNYDLLFSFLKEGQEIRGEIFFNQYLFKKETIEQFSRRYIKILASGINNHDTVIRDFKVLSAEEMKQLLYEFNRTQWEYPGSKTIERLFQEQTAKEPDRVAVVGNQPDPISITYRELNERSNRLARFLQKKRGGASSIVALMMEPSVEMIVSILGILKAGMAYLPLDAEYPGKRVQSILEDSSAAILLTREELIRRHSFRSLLSADKGKITLVETPPRPQVEQLDTLQIPNRSYIDYEKYSPYIGQSTIKDCITFQFSRGCKYNCAYCFKIWSRKLYVNRSAENMFDELLVYYKMGVRKFTFVDDLPNFNIEESSKFYRLIIKNRLKPQFFYPNGLRGDILTKDYIDLMVEAGTSGLDVALETTSQRLQKLIGKNLDLEKLDENIRYMIAKHPQLILETQILHGLPTETEEEARASLDYLKSLKWVHMPYLHVMKIFPGTAMARLAMNHGISREAIERSDSLSYNELPETLPFPKSFTYKYQSEFTTDYFLSKERLLAVLPQQMKALTQDEVVQKYNSFLPVTINWFTDLLNYVGIQPGELKTNFLPDDYSHVPDINTKIREHFRPGQPQTDALKILLIDVSAYFTSDRHGVVFDVIEPSLGLMYLQTHLDRIFGSRVHGKIISSRINFDSFAELKSIINDFKPDVIGIRTLNFYKDFFHKTISFIRQWGINVPIIAGGPYATSGYQTLLKDTNIDLVVLGEGEITFAEIIGEIIKNKGALPAEQVLQKIPGIVFVEGKEKLRQQRRRREILLWEHMTQALTAESPQNPEPATKPGDMAYIIYTSGSSGSPKGVIIQHNNLVNQITGLVKTFHFNDTHHYLLLAAFTFDVSVMHIFLPLTTGAKLFLIPDHIKKDPWQLWQFIYEKQVNILNIVPTFIKALLENLEKKKIHLDYLFVGGEVFDRELYHRLKETMLIGTTINIYGPTETTINALSFRCEAGENLMIETIPIGKPLPNYRAYILDRDLNLLPPGIGGELCIGGQGAARGYLNRPALTAEKFDHDLWDYQDKRKKRPCKRTSLNKSYIYKTGDLAKWLPDANIEFLGRIDQQVKVRGFRIECGEIETVLARHPQVREAVVIPSTVNHSTHLIVYYVAVDKERVLDGNEIRNYLKDKLPKYMIPAAFVPLEAIPLTPNGKIDRKSLSIQTIQLPTSREYIPPQNDTHRKLVEIWSAVLGIEKEFIGIGDNFFERDGHSLIGITLIAKINKEFNVHIPFSQLFKTPTIRALSSYISGAEENKFISIEAAEEKEYYPLSSAQKRMYVLQQLEPDSTSYNLPMNRILEGNLNREHLENTFKKLIQRHESLRTSFHTVKDQPVQKIYHQVEFEIEYYDISKVEVKVAVEEDQSSIPGGTTGLAPLFTSEEKPRSQELRVNNCIKSFIRPFDLAKVPQLRIGLIKINDQEHILMEDMHHIISDAISVQVMIEDLVKLSLGETLPPLRLQYKDFSQWQNQQVRSGQVKKQQDYWLNEFQGKLPVLNVPTDYARPGKRNFSGSSKTFKITGEQADSLRELAKREQATLFMLMLTLYNILLFKLTLQEDIIIGTIISGRQHPDLINIIGMFVNTLALRNYPRPHQPFNEFLRETRNRTLAALDNQDYQFEDLVEKLRIERDSNRNPLFDVVFTFDQEDSDISANSITEIGANPAGLRLEIKADNRGQGDEVMFDMLFTGNDTGKEMLFVVDYSTELFKNETIERFIKYFKEIVSAVVTDVSIRLKDIKISHDLLIANSTVYQDTQSNFEF